MASILVIEDNEQLALNLFGILFGNGHQVAVARRSSKLATMEQEHADLVVFDVDSVYSSNGSYLPWLSANIDARPPMLLLAGSKSTLKGLHYYNPTWDDCLVKPFEPGALVSRAEALLRRFREASGRVLCVGPVSVDVKKAEAKVNGQAIPLTGTEFDLLCYLLSSAGRVVSGERLLRDVWGYRAAPGGGMELLRTHIKNLRAKIGFSRIDPFTVIQTIPRQGYIVRKGLAN